jgi:hypothetical protein
VMGNPARVVRVDLPALGGSPLPLQR